VFLVAAMEGVQCLRSPERHGGWFCWGDPLELETGNGLAADVADSVLWATLTLTVLSVEQDQQDALTVFSLLTLTVLSVQ
jgi:hypothetical protein